MPRERFTVVINVATGDQLILVNTTPFKAAKEVSLFLTFIGLNGTDCDLDLVAADDIAVVAVDTILIDAKNLPNPLPVGGLTTAGGKVIQDHVMLDFKKGDRTAGTIAVIIIAK